jgi:hypothetical protein
MARPPLSSFETRPPLSIFAISEPDKVEPKKESLLTSIWSDIATRGANVQSEISNTNQNPLLSGIKATAQGFGAIGDTAGNIVRAVPGGSAVLDTVQKVAVKGMDRVTDKLSSTSIFTKLAQRPEGKLESALQGASGLGDIANNILLAEGIRSGVKKTVDTSTEVAKKLTTQSEKSIENSILESYQKGVKPLINAKTTPAKARAYKKDVVTAAKTINENKANLSFADEAGDVITGQNPKSLQQLTDAVEQTKKSVFNEYDALAQKAGEAGIGVKLQPIADELDTVISSKSLGITSPETIKYAQSLKDRLMSAEKLDATTAQDVIQNYNKSLEAFYRNPSYETASRASVDALIANKMRVALDEGITGLTGTQYQKLKSTYGALKSIEKDVIKAALRDARKNTKGLIDFTDVFSGGQVVSGILNLNVGQLASGLAQKSIAEYIKFLNNPNRAIEKMFKAVEKSVQSASKAPTP